MKEFLKSLWIIKTIIDLQQKGFWGNFAAMLIVASCGAWFGHGYIQSVKADVEKDVLAKHQQVTADIVAQKDAQEATNKVQQQMLTTLTVMQTTMQNVQGSVNEMKAVVKTTDDRVWDIRETVYQLKKTSGEGS